MKTKRIITITVTVLASFMIVFSGLMKLSHSEEVTAGLGKMGLGNYINLFGVMEILFTALFLYPKTMKIGFLLISCYFAGAIATDLAFGGNILSPMLPMGLAWIAAFLRDPKVFLPTNTQQPAGMR